MRRQVLLAVIAILPACELQAPIDEEDEDVSAAGDPIVSGEIDSGHPGVVALTFQGQAFCSGTLVTPTVVVSAAHCIHPSTGLSPGTLAQVYFGTDVTQGGVFIDVVEAEYKPDWYLDDPDGDDDVSVLRLASPAPVDPIPMGSLPPVGSSLTLVGFGITSANGKDSGTKRVAHAVMDQVYGEIFTMPLAPSGTCNGDSGGTALFDDNGVEKLVGIHTRSDCESFMIDERVDVHLAEFIQPFIDKGTCQADGLCATGCEEPDPDCPCIGDGLCTIACDDVASDPDCDPNCAANGVCATGCPSPDVDCPVCVADGVCVAGCTADPDCDQGAGGAGEGGAGGAQSEQVQPEEEEGGCTVAPRASAASSSAWALALAGLLCGARRQRAAARRRCLLERSEEAHSPRRWRVARRTKPRGTG